ncbi:hypothetical protein NE237_024310 [Protea cynaroides]|uniref:Uncharacterized protein n=1 Tax=Protea cynaroides TaxID=273540 RepID=A0A9Q0HD32_9MAGN|nr:hypothetical protein NE237_024310 [Protea cynaroides]
MEVVIIDGLSMISNPIGRNRKRFFERSKILELYICSDNEGGEGFQSLSSYLVNASLLAQELQLRDVTPIPSEMACSYLSSGSRVCNKRFRNPIAKGGSKQSRAYT